MQKRATTRIMSMTRRISQRENWKKYHCFCVVSGNDLEADSNKNKYLSTSTYIPYVLQVFTKVHTTMLTQCLEVNTYLRVKSLATPTKGITSEEMRSSGPNTNFPTIYRWNDDIIRTTSMTHTTSLHTVRSTTGDSTCLHTYMARSAWKGEVRASLSIFDYRYTSLLRKRQSFIKSRKSTEFN